MGGGLAGMQGICHFMQILIKRALRQFHHDILDVIWIGYLAKGKAFFFAGGLYENISIVKYGRDESLNGRGDVLDARKVQFADVAHKEPFLLDVHDALVSDDPDIEIVVNPQQEAENPCKDKECVFDKKEEAGVLGAENFRKEKRKDNQATNQEKGKNKNEEKMNENAEPMPVDDVEHLFILVLAAEVITALDVGHRGYRLKRLRK